MQREGERENREGEVEEDRDEEEYERVCLLKTWGKGMINTKKKMMTSQGIFVN